MSFGDVVGVPVVLKVTLDGLRDCCLRTDGGNEIRVTGLWLGLRETGRREEGAKVGSGPFFGPSGYKRTVWAVVEHPRKKSNDMVFSKNMMMALITELKNKQYKCFQSNHQFCSFSRY